MMRKLSWLALASAFAFAAGSARADETKDLPSDAKLMGEQHSIAILSKPHPKRLYVLEPVFPHIVASKVWIIDGDKQEIVGMTSAGYCSNFAIAPDSSQIYTFDTYWSKGTRGTRTDLITFFDGRTLDITAEVDLPKGRMLVVPKKQNAEVTTDGRYLLSYNLAPSTSVSVVDTRAKKYLGEIEIPGCGLIFPSAGNRFSSLCSDGTLLTATFDDKLKTKLSRVGPFIDVVNDPVYEHAAMDKQKGKVHFLSYEGMVYSADLSTEKPTISPGWSLLTEQDKAESWRPGGWQVVNMHRPTGRLYVLMHKGARWTHKTPGEEVWVFDIATKKRVNRIHLKEHAISIALSQDDDPHLYTQTETATLITYDAISGKEVGEMKFGITPYLLFTHGD